MTAKKRIQAPRFRLMVKLRRLAKELPQLIQKLPYSWNLVKILIALEVLINIIVIKNVKYTEIDWSTYMVQVGQIFNSTKLNFDYAQIEGPTGPLVYPAGHVYIFYFLRELTDSGTNIKMAQYIYMCIYIAQLLLVYKIYAHRRTPKVPPYMFLIMCLTSYRIHSIYVLRLFNDPIAVLLAYASFYCFLKKRYTQSSILFSLAISVKMNILLFVPAYALIFFEEVGLAKSIKNAAIALSIQILLALPFLYTNSIGYFNRSFNFGRVFLHQWTVNWRFLDEETFKSQEFFRILLYIHIAGLLLVFPSRWINAILKLFKPDHEYSPKLIDSRREDPILTLFIANFIGIACSRSLHYQFYVWYYHSLPMIVWATRYNLALKILILGCLEYSWNEYPSTAFSSSLMHASHLLVVIGLLTGQYKRSWWRPYGYYTSKTGQDRNGKRSHQSRPRVSS